MFRSLALGYCTALGLATLGALQFGGSFWGWALFVWLAGAPITIIVSGIRTGRLLGGATEEGCVSGCREDDASADVTNATYGEGVQPSPVASMRQADRE